MENNIKIGDTFFVARLWDGTIDKWTVIDDLGESLITHVDYENGEVEEINYGLSSFTHPQIFKTLKDASNCIQDELTRVEELFSTPEKMLNHLALKILYPLSDSSYYDLVGESSLSELEFKSFKERTFEFWGIVISDPKNDEE